jgi:hypothetical protein
MTSPSKVPSGAQSPVKSQHWPPGMENTLSAHVLYVLEQDRGKYVELLRTNRLPSPNMPKFSVHPNTESLRTRQKDFILTSTPGGGTCISRVRCGK